MQAGARSTELPQPGLVLIFSCAVRQCDKLDFLQAMTRCPPKALMEANVPACLGRTCQPDLLPGKCGVCDHVTSTFTCAPACPGRQCCRQGHPRGHCPPWSLLRAEYRVIPPWGPLRPGHCQQALEEFKPRRPGLPPRNKTKCQICPLEPSIQRKITSVTVGQPSPGMAE